MKPNNLAMALGVCAGVSFFSGMIVGTINEQREEKQRLRPPLAKVCAVVPGEEVVSTTGEFCLYATSYGRATKARRAM